MSNPNPKLTLTPESYKYGARKTRFSGGLYLINYIAKKKKNYG